jgi:DNA-binding response OmpR family regulator
MGLLMLSVRNQDATVASANANAPIHVLVVDDEAALRAILREGLEAEGFAVSEARDKASLLRSLETEPVDLITLDLGLGGEDGLELARQVRAMRNIPIVMITGRGAPIDRVAGLEHGADDYISKPFHIREVVLRIHRVLRRYELEESVPKPGAAQRYVFDLCVLDSVKREVTKVDGAMLDLTESEFLLLEIFLRHPARVLSRDEILQMLRGRDWSPPDRTIDGHLARLRRKIEPPGEAPTLIKSVRGVGYVFTGEVTSA